MTSSDGQLDLDLTRLPDWQISALIKIVQEARFPEEENEPVVWLSSFAIDLHVAAVGEQRDRRLHSFADRASRGEDVTADRSRYDKSYAFWVRWRGRREHDVVKRRIDASPDTRGWFSSLTRNEIRSLFRPFEVDDESADDLIAYARRTDPYRPEASSIANPRPYARSLPSVETPDGWIDVYEVAVLRPGSLTLTEREATSRPEEALKRLGFNDRDALDCAQNAWRTGRGQLSGWRGVLADEVWPARGATDPAPPD